MPVEDPASPATPADSVVEQLRLDVARAVRKVCPHWLAAEADDLTQTAVLRVLHRIRDTSGTVVYSPGYLYRAAHSALVDEIRRRRRLREVPIEPDRHAAPEPSGPARRVERGEIRGALMRCLASLAAARRRAVMLHLQGHTVAETGALLECDRKKAENLIYRGLADLRACLAAHEVAL